MLSLGPRLDPLGLSWVGPCNERLRVSGEAFGFAGEPAAF